jgi:hypothetical protein
MAYTVLCDTTFGIEVGAGERWFRTAVLTERRSGAPITLEISVSETILLAKCVYV